ncbi:MAG: AEC family transporter [Verrucomicrobiales bacterium]|nr:AEC family transporter [Verrucomicrobiales bacterium]
MPLSPLHLLTAILPVFGIMVLGFWFRRRGWLAESADRSILFLTINVTYPALILRKVLRDETLHDPANIWLPAACGAGFLTLGIAIAWLAAPIFGLRGGAVRRTFALSVSVQNYGYLPFPILTALFPHSPWAGVLFVYSLGIEIVLWTLGVVLLTGHLGRAARHVFNPVVGSIIVGLFLNLSGIDRHVPDWSLQLAEMLGALSIPLGLLMAGVSLADLRRLPGRSSGWGVPLGGLMLRLVVLPATMLLPMLFLSPSLEFRRVIAIQAAMPAAVFPMIMARRYGGDEPTAVRVIVFTTLASLATIPFFAPAALRWLGVG